MARVVEAVQIFKKVEDVTAAKDDPSPVYLMDELAEMARGSAEASEKIADRIAKRLQNKSPVVKFKALRLVRHIVNKGCSQFQRSMQRHANLVRDHTHFTGELDPYKGDTANQRVRDAAKEASESLFNTVMAQPVSSLGSRIQGFGGGAAPAPSSNQFSHSSGLGSGGSASGSRMVGFGSSGNSTTAAAATSSGNGSSSFGSSSFAQKGVNRPLTGNYGDASSTSTGGSKHGYGGYTAPPVTAAEVLGSEGQLVDSICTPGGLRLAPDPDDLRRFVEAAGSLDGLKVAELLRDKMDASGPWQQQLRALYALEAVLLQGATQACGEIAVMFQSDPGPVQTAAGHIQPAVRDRAGHVLKLLLGDAKSAAPAPAAAAPAAAPAVAPVAAQQATGDLLGGLDMLGSPVQTGHSVPQQQQYQAAGAVAGPDDIFSGLAVPAGPSGSRQAAVNQPLQPAPGGPGAYPGQPAWAQQGPSPPQQQHVATGGQRAPVDPFARSTDLLQPADAPTYGPPPTQQQHVQFQHQQQNLYGAYPPPGAVSGSLQQPLATTPMAPTGQMPGSHAANQAPPAATARPPLDDMFADMSLTGAGRPGPSPGVGIAHGGGYGTVNHAYGAGSASGVQGYGNPPGNLGFAPPQVPAPGGMNLGGTAQYGTVRGMGAPVALQSQPQVTMPVAQPHAAQAYGGADLLGMGPSVSATSAIRPSAGALSGPSAGLYGTGTGVGPGPLGMGMGPYAGAPAGGVGAGFGHGMGPAEVGLGGGGAGMMVGPGGQVRYVGQGMQPGTAAGGGGNMGQANGHLHKQQQQAPSGWQQPYAQQQQHLPPAGFAPNQQQQQGGAAAFDFVRDQFR